MRKADPKIKDPSSVTDMKWTLGKILVQYDPDNGIETSRDPKTGVKCNFVQAGIQIISGDDPSQAVVRNTRRATSDRISTESNGKRDGIMCSQENFTSEETSLSSGSDIEPTTFKTSRSRSSKEPPSITEDTTRTSSKSAGSTTSATPESSADTAILEWRSPGCDLRGLRAACWSTCDNVTGKPVGRTWRVCQDWCWLMGHAEEPVLCSDKDPSSCPAGLRCWNFSSAGFVYGGCRKDPAGGGSPWHLLNFSNSN